MICDGEQNSESAARTGPRSSRSTRPTSACRGESVSSCRLPPPTSPSAAPCRPSPAPPNLRPPFARPARARAPRSASRSESRFAPTDTNRALRSVGATGGRDEPTVSATRRAMPRVGAVPSAARPRYALTVLPQHAPHTASPAARPSQRQRRGTSSSPCFLVSSCSLASCLSCFASASFCCFRCFASSPSCSFSIWAFSSASCASFSSRSARSLPARAAPGGA